MTNEKDTLPETTVAETSGTVSKTKAVIEAARRRNQVEQAMAEVLTPTQPSSMPTDEDMVAGLRERAEVQASARPQSANGTSDGNIDIEAMGDVKGDGGDASQYADDDPAKRFGVPVYQHGLAATREGADELAPIQQQAFGQRMSARTQAELDRGKQALNGGSASSRSTVAVTDANDDPDGEEGRKAAERKAAADKKASSK